MTAYELRISDWSSDGCSSDLVCRARFDRACSQPGGTESPARRALPSDACGVPRLPCLCRQLRHSQPCQRSCSITPMTSLPLCSADTSMSMRSEEQTSEIQSLMRISYPVFCLKKKNHNKT